jgi:hypothetical protein
MSGAPTNPGSPANPANSLVFSGHEEGIIPWTLLGFIFLSACVHAFGFYIFQTIYPPAARVGAPPVQVGLLTPGTPEADAILRWIDSEDPALAAEPGKAPVPGLGSLPYTASYESIHARPAMAPSPEEPLRYPAGASGLDVVQMAASHPAASPVPSAPAATVLNFSGPLKDAALEPLPSLTELHEADLGELQPARFLLGVSDHGDVQYVFLQNSSGDKTLDTSASRALEKVRFRAGTAALTWGFATFYWGSPVYARPAAAAEATP